MNRSSSEARPARPPELPGYQLLGPIGSGAMGNVDLARQLSLGRLAAIKWITTGHGSDPSGRAERFRREAATMASVSHPNILTVFDFGSFDDTPYLILEYVEEGDLRHLLRNASPLPLDQAGPILRQIGEAVAHLHAKGVLHGDLKPENVLMKGGLTPRVADFGIASFLGSDPNGGEAIGTEGYVAPEQRYRLPVDERADQFSLAAMSYEILTGERPLGSFAPPSRLNPAIGPGVDHVLQKALQESPSRRFPNVSEFSRELDSALRETPSPSREIPTVAPARSSRLRYLLAALILLALAALPWRDLIDGPRRAQRSNRPEIAENAAPTKPEAPPAVVDEAQLIDRWAYLLWLKQGSPTGAAGEKVAGPNRQRASGLVQKKLSELSNAIWKGRGSKIFNDPAADKAESVRNWRDAHQLVLDHIDELIRLHNKATSARPNAPPAPAR